MTEEQPDEKPETAQQFRRQQLEPEIAAMSVEIDEDDDKPTLVVNIEDPTAKKAIRRVIVWIGGVGGVLEWWRQSVQRQIVVAMVGTAAVTTTATAVIDSVSAESPVQPPAAMRIVHVQPPVTITVTPPTAKPTPKPSKRVRKPTPSASRPVADRPATSRPIALPERSTWQPARDAQPTRERTRVPEPTRKAEPTRKPATKSARSPSPTVKATTSEPEPSTAALVQDGPMAGDNSPPTRRPEPEAQQQPQPEPTQESAPPPPDLGSPSTSRDCAVRVDLDPLLDLCVL